MIVQHSRADKDFIYIKASTVNLREIHQFVQGEGFYDYGPYLFGTHRRTPYTNVPRVVKASFYQQERRYEYCWRSEIVSLLRKPCVIMFTTVKL